MSKNWVAVASAEHVRIGRAKGFMQVSHGHRKLRDAVFDAPANWLLPSGFGRGAGRSSALAILCVAADGL